MKHTTHIEIPVTVYYDYQPFEPATSTYPGCDAEIQNLRVIISPGIDIEYRLTKPQKEAIITEIQEAITQEATDYADALADHQYEQRIEAKHEGIE